ncbi:MAG: LysM peptidoglycan-binding domain-containing protein [Flectobacillus sp.]|uniref:LysM peptidoglycan-binding domain-containing protein n=1 Tax=Flectobacillus sp. TaxID=50419 RepID=UPI003B995AE4
MKLYRYLTLIVALFPSLVLAQDIPSSMVVGTVNVKITDEARTKILAEISPLTINRGYLDRMLSRMLTYMPAVERILQEEKIPDEIKYLCVQESFLNPDARSTSDAIGYWQFKRETAKDYNLRVDAVVDERKHLMASTRAACSYFKKHRDLLGNWVASILSYRLGYTSFRKAKEMEWANKSEITVTGDTDWYIIRFLAYKLVLDQEYNKVKQNPPYNNPVLFEYSKTKGKSLYELATFLKVSTQELEVYNTWLTSKSIPDDKDYTVYLVVEPSKYQDLINLVDKDNSTGISGGSSGVSPAPNYPDVPGSDIGFPVLKRLSPANTNPNEPIYYEINGKKGILALEGDTPEKIADRGNISLKKFLKYNDLEDNERIIPNQVYYLRKKDHKAQVAFHTVRGNESLWQISQMYGINLDDLKEKNRITTVQRLTKGRLLYLIDSRSPKDDILIVKEDPASPKPQDPTPAPIKEPVNNGANTNNPIDTKMPTPIIKNPDTQPKPNNEGTTGTVNPPKKDPVDPLEPVYPNTPKPTNPTPSVPSGAYDSKKGMFQGTHRVEHKQTYFSIAKQYNMTVNELYELNGLDASVTLKVGQELKVYKNNAEADAIIGNKDAVIPVDTKKNKPVVVDEPTVPNPSKPVEVKKSTDEESKENKFIVSTKNPIFKIVHTVQKGETIFRIASFYEVSPENLKSWNNLSSNYVEIGQELTIPGEYARIPSKEEYVKPITPEVEKSQDQKYHTVKAGETAYRISIMYNLSVPQLLKINGLSGPTISVGQKLKVK